jgi:hypothetical protein
LAAESESEAERHAALAQRHHVYGNDGVAMIASLEHTLDIEFATALRACSKAPIWPIEPLNSKPL